MKKGLLLFVLILAALIAVVAWLVNSGIKELPGEKLFKYAPENAKANIFLRPGKILNNNFVERLADTMATLNDTEWEKPHKLAELCNGFLIVVNEDADALFLVEVPSAPFDEFVPMLLAAEKKGYKKSEYHGHPAYIDSDGDYHIELEPGVIMMNVSKGDALPEKKLKLSKDMHNSLAAVPPDVAAFFFGRSEFPPLPGVTEPSIVDFKGTLKFEESEELVLLADASGVSDSEGKLIAALPTLFETMLLRRPNNMSNAEQEQLSLVAELFDAVSIDYRKDLGLVTLEVVIPAELAERLVVAGKNEVELRRKAFALPTGATGRNLFRAK